MTDRGGGRFWDVSSAGHLLRILFLLLFPGGSVGKESACNVGDHVQSLGREDLLEKERIAHSSILS